MFSRHFPKTISLVLLYFCLQLTVSVLAQEKPSQLPSLKEYSFSQKEGILSKAGALFKNGQNDGSLGAFYSNTFLDKKHGLTPTPSERLITDYEFLEHLGTGMNVPYASVTDSSGNTYITGGGSNEENAQGDYITIKVDNTGTIVWETRPMSLS